jgi:hypothetical protein
LADSKPFIRVKTESGKIMVLFDGKYYDPILFDGQDQKQTFISRNIRPLVPMFLQHTAKNNLNRIRNIKKIFSLSYWLRSSRHEEIMRELSNLKYFIRTEGGRQYEDMINILSHVENLFPDPKVKVLTEHPVAVSSNDHIYPEGTALDNTRSPRFVTACENYFQKDSLKFLDIGCSGGGIVFDFLLKKHFAIGIEGSDFSLKAKRANWRVIPNHLFTCDATKEFKILENTSQKQTRFDVISCWEFFEHIPKELHGDVFNNVKNHLNPEGIFIGSIGTNVSFSSSGHPLHMTVEKFDWWKNNFKNNGFEFIENHGFEFEDFCRGVGNGLSDPDFRTSPIGFHFVARML